MAMMELQDCIDMLKLLLDNETDVFSEHYGPMPLSTILRNSLCDETNPLLENRSVSFDREVESRTTVLHLSIKLSHYYETLDIVRILSEVDPCVKHAVINARNIHGETALHMGTSRKSAATVRLLLENGADVDAVDCSGWTPLHCASYYGNHAAFETLLEFGANLNVRNTRGRTPVRERRAFDTNTWARVVQRNAKELLLGLPVVDYRHNITQANNRNENFVLDFKSEVLAMKNTPINSRVSLYDLMVNEPLLYRYANNIRLERIIYVDLGQFSNYADVLVSKYRRIQTKKRLVELSVDALEKMTGYTFEPTITDMIFSQMDNRSLHNFVTASILDVLLS